MDSRVFGASPPSGISALVVEPEEANRVFLISTLTAAGFNVTATDNFDSARAVLFSRPPWLLVTEIRLGPYNGLHLVLLGRSVRPHMTSVVTSGSLDRVLQRQAEALGTTVVRKPTTTGEFLVALCRAAFRQPNADALVESSPSRFEVRHSERRQSAPASLDGQQERHFRRRRRDIATFLLLEASRR